MPTGDDDNHGDPPPEEEEDDAGYGDVAVGGGLFSVPGYEWADVAALGRDVAGRAVRVRGAAHAVRAVGRRVAFLVLRQGSSTVQCVVGGGGGGGGGGDAGVARFAAGLSRESVVDVAGVVSLPREPARGTTQQEVEIQVKKLYCISKATPNLPISVDDAARSEEDVAKAKAAGEQLVHVGQDKRLDFRVIDLRTPANQAIFRVQCEIENIFRQVLLSEGFVGIHTPEADRRVQRRRRGGVQAGLQRPAGLPGAVASAPQANGNLWWIRACVRGWPRVQGRRLQHAPPSV
uniref:Aspartyl-tRNA synthetase n=1 Tax=Oryza meridionalis TaxID=40149 RepID=A0A0E0CFC5_9ORYZ